jgi:hypothetical protein
MSTFTFNKIPVIAATIRNWTTEDGKRKARFETESGETYMFGVTKGKLWVQNIDNSGKGENKMVNLSELDLSAVGAELGAIAKYDTAASLAADVFGGEAEVSVESIDQL